jgi:hypothetical protein
VVGDFQDRHLSVAFSHPPSPDELSVTSYFLSMHGYADEMAAIGKPLDDDDIVSYILNCLDADYNLLIKQVNGMTDSISPETLYLRLLDTEA